MTTARETADGLRELADWIEQHGDDLVNQYALGAHTFNVGCDKDELVAAGKSGGRWDKIDEGSFFTLRRTFGPVNLDFYVNREQVCQRVVVDTVEHPERVVPAHVEEVVEWVCEEPLLAERAA